MNFSSITEAKKTLSKLKSLGIGAQGESFYNPSTNEVYKIFHDYDLPEDYIEWSKDEILQFSEIQNQTYLFPKEIITLNSITIGYITKYVKGTDLCNLSPFTIDLNFLMEAIEEALKDVYIISSKGVYTYDVMYNIMLGKRIYIIDSLDYSLRDIDRKELHRHNLHFFNMSILEFLVNNYFEEIISKNKLLNEMYNSNGLDISIIEFIQCLKNYLSELIGEEITNLGEAKKLTNKHTKPKHSYIRNCTELF